MRVVECIVNRQDIEERIQSLILIYYSNRINSYRMINFDVIILYYKRNF